MNVYVNCLVAWHEGLLQAGMCCIMFFYLYDTHASMVLSLMLVFFHLAPPTYVCVFACVCVCVCIWLLHVKKLQCLSECGKMCRCALQRQLQWCREEKRVSVRHMMKSLWDSFSPSSILLHTPSLLLSLSLPSYARLGSSFRCGPLAFLMGCKHTSRRTD